MTNADLFKAIFGLYATELWAKPEKDFLNWLNSPVRPPAQSNIIRCKNCKHYCRCDLKVLTYVPENEYCSKAERRENGY